MAPPVHKAKIEQLVLFGAMPMPSTSRLSGSECRMCCFGRLGTSFGAEQKKKDKPPPSQSGVSTWSTSRNRCDSVDGWDKKSLSIIL